MQFLEIFLCIFLPWICHSVTSQRYSIGLRQLGGPLKKLTELISMFIKSVWSFSTPFGVGSRDCWVWKSLRISSYRNTQTSFCGTNSHATDKITEITFFPHSDGWCEHVLMWTYTGLYLHGFMHCIAVTWLAVYIISQISRCIDVPNKVFIKWVYFTVEIGLYIINTISVLTFFVDIY